MSVFTISSSSSSTDEVVPFQPAGGVDEVVPFQPAELQPAEFQPAEPVVSSPAVQAAEPFVRQRSRMDDAIVNGPLTVGKVRFTGADGVMCRFVDAVHAIARETKGAVHSFVGDAVTVTWNAGLRAAQHETKAVTFMCQLRDRLLGEVTVCGACTTGPGRYMMAGSVLQAMLVRVEWRCCEAPRMDASLIVGTCWRIENMMCCSTFC